MKITFEHPVVDLLGNQLKEGGEPITFSPIVANALINPQVKMGDFLKKYSLAQKIARKEELELDAADLKLIKDIIALPDIFTPMIQAQLTLFLDNHKE